MFDANGIIAEDSHEVVDEEEDVMDEHDLPLGTSDLDIPEHDSDDIIEITHETLATKLSVPSKSPFGSHYCVYSFDGFRKCRSHS